MLSTLLICLEPSNLVIYFLPNFLANKNDIEQEKKSAKNIITNPCVKPNWNPAAAENIVPGKTGIMILVDLKINNKKINIKLKKLFVFKPLTIS